MSHKMLRVIERKAIPTGTEAYEAQRAVFLESLSDKIPDSLRLSEDIVDNPPLDITGVFKSCGLLSEKDLIITEGYDATSLASAIASRELKAVDVAVAFAKRAAIAHQLTCCLTDWFMDEAVARAQYLDDYLEKHGKTIGPLHGVPISVKEHIPLKDHYASWGFFATRTMIAQDCQMTRILRDAGAVFYVKTSQPQAIMHLESVSCFGRVLMPRNINLSAGGSSGGESALVSCRGSVLGIGTDIGGSIRGPAAFCGIYGFKPTAYTLPCKDFVPGAFPAELNVLASVGPMCTSLRDCDLFVRVLKAANPHLEDPRIVPIPWTGLATPMELPLKIGILTHDDVIVPQPPVLAALAWAEKKFSEQGIAVKAFKPFQVTTAMANIRKAYWPDSGLAEVRICEESGEPLLLLTSWIIKDALDTVERTGTEVNAMRWARDNFRSDFARHWNEQDVDIVIAPAFVGPACAHDTALYWNYTAFWNYTDYPGIVFPTPVVAGKTKEEYPAEYSTPLSKEDEHVREMWKETDFQGAPINLQVIARKHHDNQLFGALNVLKDVLNVVQVDL